ncbi:response regulator [Scytonema sp. UIC 10036]|uniref:response regulator n=1 Tax=Scytonema sp. UIC 10036 TaxID=2304196 RepID=UPI0012DA3A27|nr:response regulator [Scytonema sp. UIC 10036]MUG98336.1 response regulator [Scytonema sp. UIC 10036]
MSLTKFTILVAEDDPNDAFFIQRAFQKTQLVHTLKVLEDGDAVIDYLSGIGEYADREQYPLPTLILLDIKLLRRSGLEVLEWIRQQPHLKRLLVIMLTSSDQDSDINLAYELGANSYLTKPIGIDNLQEMVNSINQYWLLLNKQPEIEQ